MRLILTLLVASMLLAMAFGCSQPVPENPAPPPPEDSGMDVTAKERPAPPPK